MTGRQNGPAASRTREQTMMRNIALITLASFSLVLITVTLRSSSFGNPVGTEIWVLASGAIFISVIFYRAFAFLRRRGTVDSTKPT
jgi:hypothetical protein